MLWKQKIEPWKLGKIIYPKLLQISIKVDDVVFQKKLTSFTILTFIANYEIRHSSFGDECNFVKMKGFLHPNVSNDNFP
jgi:hypothetical protein